MPEVQHCLSAVTNQTMSFKNTTYMMAGFKIIMGIKRCVDEEVRKEQTPEKKEPSKNSVMLAGNEAGF